VRAWILHVDLDQFIAAVEVRRRPELRGLPVVVGGSGDPTARRQVVATASYEARDFGVHSGMPLRMAARKCPDAVFLPSDPAAYEEASAEVMQTLREFPVVVEVWGWDEAFLGAKTDDPEALAHAIRTAVLERTGLSCSVGVGENKQQAKLATGFAKPAGVARLTHDTWWEIMGDRPTEALWGVGPRMAHRLAELGLHTVRQLASADSDVLSREFGPRMGPWYGLLGRGIGDTHVTDVPWVPKSRSHETTYPEDVADPAEIAERVAGLARAVTREVVDQGRTVVRVAVKVRFSSFFTQTRISKLPEPTREPEAVAAAALRVLGRFELGRPVRLLGVRVELNDVAAARDGGE
jgi:DNA polymerase-4